jgi:hypothetical protein
MCIELHETVNTQFAIKSACKVHKKSNNEGISDVSQIRLAIKGDLKGFANCKLLRVPVSMGKAIEVE